MLTATTVLVLVVAFAGCGRDDPSATSAQSAGAQTTATTTTPAAAKDASPATTTSGSKASGSKASGSKASGSKASGSKSSGKKTAAKKKTRKSPSVVTGVTPSKTSTTDAPPEDSTSGTGSGPAADRLAVVAALRRYYTAFVNKDGSEVCSLLTSEGRKVMTSDGGARTCPASAERLVKLASAENLKLLEATRDGVHVDDITVTGDGATAQIGKTSRLKLSQENGKWLVRSPNVEQTQS